MGRSSLAHMDGPRHLTSQHNGSELQSAFRGARLWAALRRVAFRQRALKGF